jgi:hypothetical protein
MEMAKLFEVFVGFRAKQENKRYKAKLQEKSEAILGCMACDVGRLFSFLLFRLLCSSPTTSHGLFVIKYSLMQQNMKYAE